jgi:ribonuclease BN (tRNA processing enzyme)
VEVCWGEDSRLILDAGTGIRLLGEELASGGRPPSRIDILFSHLHWDHIQGLPFFIPMYIPGVDIHLWGRSGKGITLDRMMDHQLHSAFFPIGRAELAANLFFHLIHEGELEFPGIKVTACHIQHPGGAFAFRIEAGGKVLIYATDHEFDSEKSSIESKFDQNFIKLATGADLMIHDAQYTDSEYQSYRKGWGHSSHSNALKLAKSAGVKQLALFHHDPSHTDEQLAAFEKTLRSETGDLPVFFAREGETIQL